MTEGIKQLNIYFSMAEYNKLYKIKRKKELSWHDLILLLTSPEIAKVIGTNDAD